MWYSGASSQHSGRFLLSPDLEVNGTLALSGRDATLRLWAPERFHVPSKTTINGRLDDLRSVSLIGCRVISQQSLSRHDRYTCSLVVLPQCIVFGHHDFSADDDVVTQISLDLEHSLAIFDDSDAYGTVFNNPDILESIIASQQLGRTITIDDWNWVAYYTGKKNVFSADTAIARVSADHRPTFTMGDPSNFGLIKKTELCLTFHNALTVMESLHRVDRVLQFFDLVVGRPMVVSEIRMATALDVASEPAHIYPTVYTARRRRPDDRDLGTNTILINPVQKASAFSELLTHWVAKDDSWAPARARLRGTWAARHYSVDRLVAAANVFDLLPIDIYGSKPLLSQDLKDAKRQARTLFRGLPESQGRSYLLGCLGRLDAWTLKRKIGHRAGCIVNTIGALIPHIDDVIRDAVALRNDYVHGPSRGYEQRSKHLVFFTDSLEFIFLASDLIDAGWDIATWLKAPKSAGHPFGDYLASYHANVNR